MMVVHNTTLLALHLLLIANISQITSLLLLYHFLLRTKHLLRRITMSHSLSYT